MKYSEFEIESHLRSGAHEPELRREFGNRLYDELANLAKELGASRATQEAARQKVYILPGIMGSRLSQTIDGVQDLIWIDPPDLIGGGLAKLKLSAKNNTVSATGTVFAPYLRMRLRMRLAGFDARFLPYDWRLSPEVSGKALIDKLRRAGVEGAALVAHSMGGLVARAMAAGDAERKTIERIITVGTPNHGSYSPVELLALTHGMLGQIGVVDLKHTKRELATDILRHLPGLLHMLPAPNVRPDEGFLTSAGWPKSAVKPLKAALTAAKSAIARLPAPDERFIQIVGYDEKTIVRAGRKGNAFVFEMARDGDGTVPREFAEMGDVPRYYTKGGHGWLCNRRDVINASIDLIKRGATERLPQKRPFKASESVGVEKIEADALAKRRATDDVAEKDTELAFTGAFLSREMEHETQEDDEMVIGMNGTNQSARKAGGYPADLVAAAAKRWNASKVERTLVEQNRRDAHPLASETPYRLKAHTERLLTLIKAVPREEKPEVQRLLEGIRDDLDGVDPNTESLTEETKQRLERVIGEAEEFLSVMFVKRAAVAANAVGRITAGGSFGTGFLVAPGIMMTNEHVLPDLRTAKAASIQFQYEREIDDRETPGHVFKLEPDRLFHADKKLDMALVAVATTSKHDDIKLSSFGQLPLIYPVGKILKGQPVNIVQHPEGKRKQIVVRESYLSALPDEDNHVAQYTGDTMPGSSGAPVFNDWWEVVALHHAGVPDMDEDDRVLDLNGGPWNEAADPEMKTVKWIANEGIRVSRIMAALEQLPEQLDRDNRPGADLVRWVLAISEWATEKGVFAVKGMPPGPNGEGLDKVIPADEAPGPVQEISEHIPDHAAVTVSHTENGNAGDMQMAKIILPIHLELNVRQGTTIA